MTLSQSGHTADDRGKKERQRSIGHINITERKIYSTSYICKNKKYLFLYFLSCLETGDGYIRAIVKDDKVIVILHLQQGDTEADLDTRADSLSSSHFADAEPCSG